MNTPYYLVALVKRTCEQPPQNKYFFFKALHTSLVPPKHPLPLGRWIGDHHREMLRTDEVRVSTFALGTLVPFRREETRVSRLCFWAA